MAMNISWSGPRAGIPVGGRAEDIKVTYALRRSYADGGGSRTEDFRGCRRCHRVGCSRHGGDRNVELIEIAGRLEPARRGGEGNHLRYTRLEPQEIGFGSAVFTCRDAPRMMSLGRDEIARSIRVEDLIQRSFASGMGWGLVRRRLPMVWALQFISFAICTIVRR